MRRATAPDFVSRRWAEVSLWLRGHTRHHPGPAVEPIAVAMNLALQLRGLLPRLHRPDTVLDLVRS